MSQKTLTKPGILFWTKMSKTSEMGTENGGLQSDPDAVIMEKNK